MKNGKWPLELLCSVEVNFCQITHWPMYLPFFVQEMIVRIKWLKFYTTLPLHLFFMLLACNLISLFSAQEVVIISYLVWRNNNYKWMITLLNHNIIFITTKLFKKSGNLTFLSSFLASVSEKFYQTYRCIVIIVSCKLQTSFVFTKFLFRMHHTTQKEI